MCYSTGLHSIPSESNEKGKIIIVIPNKKCPTTAYTATVLSKIYARNREFKKLYRIALLLLKIKSI